MESRSGVSSRTGKTVTLPISETRGRFAAGRSLQTEIEAAWVGDSKTFWLCREIGRNRSVSEPFAWQLES